MSTKENPQRGCTKVRASNSDGFKIITIQ